MFSALSTFYLYCTVLIKRALVLAKTTLAVSLPLTGFFWGVLTGTPKYLRCARGFGIDIRNRRAGRTALLAATSRSTSDQSRLLSGRSHSAPGREISFPVAYHTMNENLA